MKENNIFYGLAPLFGGILAIIYNLTIAPPSLVLVVSSFATGFFLVVISNSVESWLIDFKKGIKNEQ